MTAVDTRLDFLSPTDKQQKIKRPTAFGKKWSTLARSSSVVWLMALMAASCSLPPVKMPKPADGYFPMSMSRADVTGRVLLEFQIMGTVAEDVKVLDSQIIDESNSKLDTKFSNEKLMPQMIVQAEDYLTQWRFPSRPYKSDSKPRRYRASIAFAFSPCTDISHYPDAQYRRVICREKRSPLPQPNIF